MRPQWENGRGVAKRIFIECDLVLDSPTHIGNGEGDLIDMPLLLHEGDKLPLLMGSSVAGALRSYLVQAGLEKAADSLFGKGTDDSSCPSRVIVDDSFGSLPKGCATELRDGVAISLETKTAIDKAKFDIELLPAGTVFPLSFELLVMDNEDKDIDYFAAALKALKEGKISIGMRKRRGYGRCYADKWRVYVYDMATPEGLIGWLERDKSKPQGGEDITELMGAKPVYIDMKRFTMTATFKIDSSMLIHWQGMDKDAPDAVHIHSHREGRDAGDVPVLSGTSLGGALRARAYNIVNTLGISCKIVNDIFGSPRDDRDKHYASRLWVDESEIKESKEMVQNRIKIDRFTGGAYPHALFNEQPVYGGEVTIKLALDKPEDIEVGLLLLLLKDLWTSDLALGGGSSIGRGRMKGIDAKLDYVDKGTWTIKESKDGLDVIGKADELEDFVSALAKEARK